MDRISRCVRKNREDGRSRDLIPAANKSLSTAFAMTLLNGGIAPSNTVVSRAISWDALAPEWRMLGRTYTTYDSLIIFFVGMTLLMLATIGLVPPIMKKQIGIQ